MGMGHAQYKSALRGVAHLKQTVTPKCTYTSGVLIHGKITLGVPQHQARPGNYGMMPCLHIYAYSLCVDMCPMDTPNSGFVSWAGKPK